MQVSIFLLIRIVAGLSIGLWLVRKASNPLRAMVVRLMPLKYRISEKSFLHQARLTTAVSALLVVLIAGAVNYGIGRAAGLFTDPARPKETEKEFTQQDKSEVISFGVPLPGPEEPAAKTPADPATTTEPVPVVAPPKPKPEARPAATIITEETWFLQLCAFEGAENAWAQKTSLDRRLPKLVWVGLAGADFIPYKVLVGPFANRQSAMKYRKQKRLGGYARQLEDIRLFAQ